ncbi:unnamed protein product [Aureobasidium mustum]|uniref:C2H2-type domain-containing protein n=1 Tax=Aureobasidium mustum TaxID=2773714 RepID=A0A9N8PHU8_9PEZI|nr:unnamed protein product [Aureobasidium mustum]
MDDQQRQALKDELSKRDDPHVMIVRYDDKLERIGTSAENVTFHSNPIQAVKALYLLLLTGPARRSHHYTFLKNGQYLIKWLNAHSNSQAPPTPNDLVDEIMSDLTENLTVYHKITYLTIIPYLEYHTRDHGTLAWRIEAITDLPLEHAYDLDNEQSCINTGPDSQLLEGEMPSTGPLIDIDAVVMFDHDAPPVWVPPDEFSFLDDEVQAQLLPFETEPYTPLFSEPTPGPVTLPQANNAPPREVRHRGLSLDARRVFACTFPECSSRFTRPSDLRRHWINVHRGHTQQ